MNWLQKSIVHYCRLVRALFAQPNPSPIKYAMTKLGFDTLDVRMPMMEMLPEEKAAFDKIWDTYQEKAKYFRELAVQ